MGVWVPFQWVPWGGCGICLIDWGGFFPLAETTCAATEFRCRDGTCIGNSSRCNQFIDCEDASDEMNCSECPAAALGPSSALEMLLLSVLAAGTVIFGIWAGSGREEGPAPVLQPQDEAAPAHTCSPRVPCSASHHPMDPCSSGHVWGISRGMWGVVGSSSRAGVGAMWWSQTRGLLPWFLLCHRDSCCDFSQLPLTAAATSSWG